MRTSLRQPTAAERQDSKNNLLDEDDDWKNQAIRAANFDRNVGHNGQHPGESFGRRGDTFSTLTSDAYAGRAPESRRPPDFLLKPPELNQHPNFDARVASEYLDSRGVKARGDSEASGATKEIPPDHTRDSSVGPGIGQCLDFEADVERAVRNLEHQLLVRRDPDNPIGSYSPTTSPRANGAETSVSSGGAQPSSGPRRPSSQAVGDGDGGILSRMDALRAPQGRGKGRSGGLKDMWKGEEGYISGNRNHERHGSGLAGMWKEGGGSDYGGGAFPGGRRSFSGRQGPGIKSLWSGGDRDSVPGFQPQRQGPGLRALWSGPDTAEGDAAKSDAQAAYLRALDRDAHERQAISHDPPPQQGQQRRSTLGRIEPSPGDVDDGVGFGSTRGAGRGRRHDDSPKDIAVRSAAIGTPPGVPTSHRGPRWPWEPGGNEDRSRMFEKAKKATYGEELRRQIAENEARKAAEKRASGRVHRRASTGVAEGRVISLHENDIEAGNGWPVSSRSLVQNFERDPQSPSSHSGRGNVADSWRAPPAVERRSAAVQHSPGPANGGETDPHLTVARRRMMEQVYGGSGMGAALRGPGYRRRSTGGYGTVGINLNVADSDSIDNSSAAAADAANAATSRGAAYLRTGAGMQSLNETDHSEKSQRRAAALEQQRALEEQIEAKARAKVEQDDRRKREEDEEARQQQERLRQMDAEAEDERRRKQAEQQAQLDGLYRQQEEALRKKRVGTVNLRCRSDAGASPRDDRQRQSIRAPPPDGGFSDSLDQDHRPSQAQWATEWETSLSSANTTTSRRRCGVTDVNDLPAGVQARAQVLHINPRAAERPDASTSSKQRAFPIEYPTGGNFTPRTEKRTDLPTDIGASGPDFRSSYRSQSVRSDSPALRSHTPRTDRHTGSPADVGPSVEAHAFPPPAAMSSSPRVLGSRRGETRPEVIGRKKDLDEESCARSVSVTSSVARVGRGPTLASTDEALLRTRSSLIPVESSMLFPASAGVDLLSLPGGDDEETTLACAGANNGGTTPAGTKPASEFSSRNSPQDEMDAFSTSWQTEQLRRLGQRTTLAAEPSPHQCKTVGGFTGLGGGSTAATSPFRAHRKSRTPSRSRGGRDSGNAWEEQSLAPISRSNGLSSPPLMDKETNRRNRERVEVCVDEGERPLESDSVLFYLTGEHRQDSPNTSLSPINININREAAGVDGPGSAQRESDQDEMSPLTRLLAETPVKLPDGATWVPADNGAGRTSLAVRGGHERGNGDLCTSRNVKGARALWRDRTWGGEGVAEALQRGGGGIPWEEIPDVGASFSGPS